jgi:hypothetical protein
VVAVVLVVAQDHRADPVVQVAEDGVILVPLLVALLRRVPRVVPLDTVLQAARAQAYLIAVVVVAPGKQVILMGKVMVEMVASTRNSAAAVQQAGLPVVAVVVPAVSVVVAPAAGAMVRHTVPTAFPGLLIPGAVVVVVIKPMVVQQLVAQVDQA